MWKKSFQRKKKPHLGRHAQTRCSRGKRRLLVFAWSLHFGSQLSFETKRTKSININVMPCEKCRTRPLVHDVGDQEVCLLYLADLRMKNVLQKDLLYNQPQCSARKYCTLGSVQEYLIMPGVRWAQSLASESLPWGREQSSWSSRPSQTHSSTRAEWGFSPVSKTFKTLAKVE